MMYDEFTNRLAQVGVAEFPDIHQYTEIIEPVYNYHPVFDDNNAKLRCAQLYAAGGLGIFYAMRDTAELAREKEEEFNKLRREFEKVKIDFEAAAANAKEWREMVRTDWRCA